MKAARKISNHIFRRFFPNKTEIVADIYHHFLSLLYNRHTQPIAYQVSYVHSARNFFKTFHGPNIDETGFPS